MEPRGSASEEPAARTFKEAAGTVATWAWNPESFTYAEKESYVRFAPFMGMRSCALEPRSEMQGAAAHSLSFGGLRGGSALYLLFSVQEHTKHH